MILAAPLVIADEAPVELIAILADRVRSTSAAHGWRRPKVVVCDHGSPQRAVAEVRDRLAAELAVFLGDEVESVAPASMERREGEAYAFNEPLLATLLARAPFDTGEVVVVLQFLSPGRHAGPGGDVAAICEAAEEAARTWGRRLRIAMTEPMASDPRLLAVLARRMTAAAARLGAD